ncbi:MAG: phosphodiesterase [Firmicutes bacterium]|nr:phosphodiesterase [Bacillota bacterium]
MKIMAMADLHGSGYYAKLAYQRFLEEKPDKVVTLGDMVYQGVRNPLTREFSGPDTVEQLNLMAEKSMGVRGNCDADVHQEFLKYPMMADYLLIIEGGRTIFATHGHIFNQDHMPGLEAGDVLLMGHFHKPSWYKKDGVWCMNPGSLACPKEDTPHGYLIIEDGKTFTWKNVEDGSVFHKEVLD